MGGPIRPPDVERHQLKTHFGGDDEYLKDTGVPFDPKTVQLVVRAKRTFVGSAGQGFVRLVLHDGESLIYGVTTSNLSQKGKLLVPGDIIRIRRFKRKTYWNSAQRQSPEIELHRTTESFSAEGYIRPDGRELLSRIEGSRGEALEACPHAELIDSLILLIEVFEIWDYASGQWRDCLGVGSSPHEKVFMRDAYPTEMPWDAQGQYASAGGTRRTLPGIITKNGLQSPAQSAPSPSRQTRTVIVDSPGVKAVTAGYIPPSPKTTPSPGPSSTKQKLDARNQSEWEEAKSMENMPMTIIDPNSDLSETRKPSKTGKRSFEEESVPFAGTESSKSNSPTTVLQAANKAVKESSKNTSATSKLRGTPKRLLLEAVVIYTPSRQPTKAKNPPVTKDKSKEPVSIPVPMLPKATGDSHINQASEAGSSTITGSIGLPTTPYKRQKSTSTSNIHTAARPGGIIPETPEHSFSSSPVGLDEAVPPTPCGRVGMAVMETPTRAPAKRPNLTTMGLAPTSPVQSPVAGNRSPAAAMGSAKRQGIPAIPAHAPSWNQPTTRSSSCFTSTSTTTARPNSRPLPGNPNGDQTGLIPNHTPRIKDRASMYRKAASGSLQRTSSDVDSICPSDTRLSQATPKQNMECTITTRYPNVRNPLSLEWDKFSRLEYTPLLRITDFPKWKILNIVAVVRKCSDEIVDAPGYGLKRDIYLIDGSIDFVDPNNVKHAGTGWKVLSVFHKSHEFMPKPGTILAMRNISNWDYGGGSLNLFVHEQVPLVLPWCLIAPDIPQVQAIKDSLWYKNFLRQLELGQVRGSQQRAAVRSSSG